MSNATRGMDFGFLEVFSLLHFWFCGSCGCLSSKTMLVPMPAFDQAETTFQCVEEVDMARSRRGCWRLLLVVNAGILRKAAARSACVTNAM